MAELRVVTKEERAEWLKKCCETIMEHAEEFTEEAEIQTGIKITIDMPCDGLPVITYESMFHSKKMIETINS